MKHHTMLLLAGASALALGTAPAYAMPTRTGGITAAATAPVSTPAVVRSEAAIAEGAGPTRVWKANAAPVNETAAEVASGAATGRAPLHQPAAAVAPVRSSPSASIDHGGPSARLLPDAVAPGTDTAMTTAAPAGVDAPAVSPVIGIENAEAVTLPGEPVAANPAAAMPEAEVSDDAAPVPPAAIPPAVTVTRPMSLAALRNVYVSDPGAPWFMSWYDETLERTGPLFSPDIEIAPNDDILAMLASAPGAAGVMPASEFAAYDAGGELVATPTGVRVCAAFVLGGGGPIDQIGDLHLLPDQVTVAVTQDTMSIASRVFAAYDVADKVVLTEASAGAAMLAVGSGDLALAVTRVGDGEVVDFHGAGGARVLELSEAMLAAGERLGLVEGRIGTDMVQGFVPQFRVSTLCDEIVAVAADTADYAPELLVRGGGGLPQVANLRANGVPGDDDLWARTGDAIGQLQSILWGGGSEGAR